MYPPAGRGAAAMAVGRLGQGATPWWSMRTCAAVLSSSGRSIGGNADHWHDGAGVLVHPCGPHIFHTHATDVVADLSR